MTKRRFGNCNSCNERDDYDDMVCCDSCDEWHHYVCVGVGASIGNLQWFCQNCLAIFTVVKTKAEILNNKINTIPDLWIRAKGTEKYFLCPRFFLKRVFFDAVKNRMKPNSDWQKISCVVLESKFITFQEAKAAEESIIRNLELKKRAAAASHPLAHNTDDRVVDETSVGQSIICDGDFNKSAVYDENGEIAISDEGVIYDDGPIGGENSVCGDGAVCDKAGVNDEVAVCSRSESEVVDDLISKKIESAIAKYFEGVTLQTNNSAETAVSRSVNESTKADNVDTVDHCICGAVGGSATNGAFSVTAVAVPCKYPTKIRLPIKDTAMVAPLEAELVKCYDYFKTKKPFQLYGNIIKLITKCTADAFNHFNSGTKNFKPITETDAEVYFKNQYLKHAPQRL